MLRGITSRPPARPQSAKVLDPAFVELGDLECWAFTAAEEGETELIVDLTPIEPVGAEVLTLLGRLRQILDRAGIRMALVCAASDLAVLKLGHFERSYVLAASENAAVEGLRATRPSFGAIELGDG